MNNLPQFLRFVRVVLDYKSSVYSNVLPIEKKCQSVVNYLQPLKLNDTLIHFIGFIHQTNRNNFISHSQLLDHLRNELLPICGSSRGYKFEIFTLDEVSCKDLIAQILQMPPIVCCSNVEISIHGRINYPIQLPIEPISNWLHRNCEGREEMPKERFLRIISSKQVCVQELCDHLKKVTILLTLNNFWLKILAFNFRNLGIHWSKFSCLFLFLDAQLS